MTRLHPRECGFQLGLEVTVSKDGRLDGFEWKLAARELTDIVYVAVRADGVVLKVGETGGTLLKRWRPVLRLLDAKNAHVRFKTHEFGARDAWWNYVKGQQFEVWLRGATKIELECITGVKQFVSIRHAEEEYLDDYYCPQLGKLLTARKLRASS